MKKRTLKALACAAAMALVLSVTACGSKETDAPADDVVEDAEDEAEPEAEPAEEPEAEAETETEPEAEAETETETETDVEGSGEGQTFEDYYNDPAVKAVFDAQMEALAGQGMTIDLEVKGNEMTMIYQYEEGIDLPENAKELLDAALEENAATFEEQAGNLDLAIGQTNACSVVVRYLDADGNLLTERAFKAQ